MIVAGRGKFFAVAGACLLRGCWFCAILLGCLAGAADAADDTYPNVSLHGFGTLGAVYHDDAKSRFRRDDSQPDGARSHRLDFDPDSSLGLRLDAHMGPRLEAALQVVARQTWENNYRPQVTWAYLKFLLGEQTAVRVGRLGIDTFLRGDVVDIDYGNLMVRPQFSFHPHSFDGVDAEFSRPLGAGIFRLKGYAGYEYDKRVEIDGSVSSFADSRVSGLSAEYEQNAWTGRIALGQLRFGRENIGLQPGDQLLAVLNVLPNGTAIQDKLTIKDRRLNYGMATLIYDSGTWQGTAAYGRIASEDWPTRQVFFSNIGYRIGNITPYLGYSVQHTSRRFIASGFPAGMSALTDALGQVSALAQAGLVFNQSDVALGLRYDFARNRVFKLQVEHIRYKDPDGILNPALMALDAPVQARDYQSMTLLTLAFNFIF